MKRLGLLINPAAGLGGRVGLKGSDGVETQRRALELGAQPQAGARAALALERLVSLRGQFELWSAPGSMGADAARAAGFEPRVTGEPLARSMLSASTTSAADTLRAAREMLAEGVDLLLFAGGDGTARDIYTAVGQEMPALGIPAGVKIHSAVFATHPRAAGELAAAFLRGERLALRVSEVVDLDEEAYRAGAVVTRLYGSLNTPYRPHLLQARKAPSPAAESARLEAIAAHITQAIAAGWLGVLGPGSTTAAVARWWGLPKTLVGVDVYRDQAVVALDVSEASLLALLEDRPARIVVTPIGGQGFLFGRGNQQISAEVIRKVGRENILTVALSEKLAGLRGEPLLVDTGAADVDALLAGYLPVVVGYRETVMYRVG